MESIPVKCENGQVSQPQPETTESTIDIFQDEFNNNTLNSEWKWANEDKSHWSLTVIPGSIQIITQRGDIYGKTNNLRNLLLQAAPNENFLVTTLLTIIPNAHAQQGGIIIYQDNDNYIRLTRGYMFQSNAVEYTYEKNSVATSQRLDLGSTTVYLSILKQEDVYTGSYSLDGVTWIPIGIFGQVDLKDPKVGVSAWNGDLPTEEIPVNFDFVKIAVVSR